MKVNLNQIDLTELDNLEDITYERRTGKNRVKKFKTDEARGKGKKPKKFRDFNKKISN
tara:strand:+ start:9716 stop:9889 length:174 start_codon:yes stop_codon:yes gene_type:complete